MEDVKTPADIPPPPPGERPAVEVDKPTVAIPRPGNELDGEGESSEKS